MRFVLQRSFVRIKKKGIKYMNEGMVKDLLELEDVSETTATTATTESTSESTSENTSESTSESTSEKVSEMVKEEVATTIDVDTESIVAEMQTQNTLMQGCYDMLAIIVIVLLFLLFKSYVVHIFEFIKSIGK